MKYNYVLGLDIGISSVGVNSTSPFFNTNAPI